MNCGTACHPPACISAVVDISTEKAFHAYYSGSMVGLLFQTNSSRHFRISVLSSTVNPDFTQDKVLDLLQSCGTKLY